LPINELGAFLLEISLNLFQGTTLWPRNFTCQNSI